MFHFSGDKAEVRESDGIRGFSQLRLKPGSANSILCSLSPSPAALMSL